MFTATRTRSTGADPARIVGLTTTVLAGGSLLTLGASAPWAIPLASTAGRVGSGAGPVVASTAGIFALVLAAAAWSAITTDRRQVRVRPLVAAASLFGLAFLLSLRLAYVTLTGDGRAAGLSLGFLLFAAIGAGALFGIASAPVAAPLDSRAGGR